METAIVIVALIALFGFRQWLGHHRRIMLHRERLAAIEKGIELPPVEQELRRGAWNVQRILLLMGLIWVSLGLGVFVTLSALVSNHATDVPPGIEWVAIAPVAIGLSHLVVHSVGRKKDA
jgi:hypothetical protein